MKWLENVFDIESLETLQHEWTARAKWLFDYRETLDENAPRFIYHFFRIYSEGKTAGYDEYLGFVVIARTLKEAQLMIIDNVSITNERYILSMDVHVLGTSALSPYIVLESYYYG